ncbi:MAG: DUF2804 domain-containing protein [Candidatus Nanopelagicales bacterium]|nr:DUF2804 domain-containing protein [Candidatus Nanopelagicales bacterium]
MTQTRGKQQPYAIPASPNSVLDAEGKPNFGMFTGAPEATDFSGLTGRHSRNPVGRFLRHKKWMYVFAATDEVVLIAAIVDAGPTGTAFLMATDRATGEVLADTSRPGGMRPMVSVNDRPIAGHRSRYTMPGTSMAISGDKHELTVTATIHRFPFVPMASEPWVELDLRLSTDVHPGLTAVSEINDGRPLVSTTVKNAALPTTGQLTIRADGRTTTLPLTGGLGGYDYTNGYLPRHTNWRWAFTTGRSDEGRTIGLNLVSGFTGIGDNALENGIWLDGQLRALDPAARIEFDPARPDHPWTVRTLDGSVDLVFQPATVHAEALNLGILRSQFIQPSGHFSGTVQFDGERLQIDALPGVVEHQDVLW